MKSTNSTVGAKASDSKPTSIGGRTPTAMSTCFVTVGGETCAVRVANIHSIPEVLGFEDEMQLVLSAAADGDSGDLDDPQAIADLLESRMIAPPRPRRRRERAVSSRAVFFHAAAR